MTNYAMAVGAVMVAASAFGSPLPAPYGRIPAIVSVVAVDARASENTNDTGRFVLRRALNMRSPLVVYYRISGTASNGVDYERLTNVVRFEAGQSSVTVVVKPIDDLAVERSETVT